jgi:hypothetical protein
LTPSVRTGTSDVSETGSSKGGSQRGFGSHFGGGIGPGSAARRAAVRLPGRWADRQGGSTSPVPAMSPPLPHAAAVPNVQRLPPRNPVYPANRPPLYQPFRPAPMYAPVRPADKAYQPPVRPNYQPAPVVRPIASQQPFGAASGWATTIARPPAQTLSAVSGWDTKILPPPTRKTGGKVIGETFAEKQERKRREEAERLDDIVLSEASGTGGW